VTRSAALRALNARRLDLHLARLELLKAVREVERQVYRKDESMFHRKQA
jgi:hypothetical protein